MKITKTQLKNIIKESVINILKENGNLPLGAEYDPSAPWNDDSEETTKCTIYFTIYFKDDTSKEYSMFGERPVEYLGYDEDGYMDYEYLDFDAESYVWNYFDFKDINKEDIEDIVVSDVD